MTSDTPSSPASPGDFMAQRLKDQQASMGERALRPADLEGKRITVTGLDRYAESKNLDAAGRPKPMLFLNVTVHDGKEKLERQMLCSGALMEDIGTYFDQAGPDASWSGVLVKGEPWEGAGFNRWMIVEPSAAPRYRKVPERGQPSAGSDRMAF